MSLKEEDIILEGALKRCKRHKLFKTKWIERYFVLHCRDRARKLYAIDEYKSSRKNQLKKRFNLDYVYHVESNLTFLNPTISCSAAHHQDTLNWIFSIGFRLQGVQKDLFLVAKNDVEMSLWVNEICKLCKLHRQNEDMELQEGDVSQAGESSISGMSMSSQSLDMSIIEQQQYAENLPDPKQYLRMHHFKSVNSQQSLPRDSNPNYNNLPDTRSETSSMYSSRRTEDDSVSYTSGPPIPPPRTRHTLNRFVKNGAVGRLHMIPASTSMSQVVKEDGADSSGETLKLDSALEPYPESVTSSEGITVYERNGRALIRRAPPPVDRSNKPKNLRGEEEGTRYRNLSRNSSADNYSNFHSKISTYQMPDPSKRKNLDYFEPTQLVEHLSSSTVANSTRSPTPSDIEYISVDVDRTLAFKQMRRAAPSNTDYSI
uniref:PH domain-containing protein n=1 Tax=Caenorhabditis japonica TaxID=281687 RepID=A0A8R1I3G5_CAEJA